MTKKNKPDISIQSHSSIKDFQQWLKISDSKLAQALRALRLVTPDQIRQVQKEQGEENGSNES